MQNRIREWLTPLLALALCLTLSTMPLRAQEPASQVKKLKINILEGDGQINLVRQRVATEPVVEVVDENNRPVAGAIVTFTLPGRGAGGSFLDGAQSLSAQTNAQGQATATGFQANQAEGSYNIRVNVSHQGKTARTVISQANTATAGATTAAAGVTVGGGIATKTLLTILVIAGAAAGGTAVALTQGGSSTGVTATPPRAGVSLGGAGTVGAPGTP